MALYALTAVLSAFLLFLIQPIVGKLLLPQFGGSAAVWSVCLLFFQCTLLAGYWYSHSLVIRAGRRLSPWIHAGLLAASLVLLFLLPWSPPPPSLRFPTLEVLWRLAALIGLPFLALSATTPLVQAWYAERRHAQLPYHLFAFSNAGSLAALAAYPFLIEPRIGLSLQVRLWTLAYAGFVLLCGFAAFYRRETAVESAPQDSAQPPGPPVLSAKVTWLLLAATASALLVTVTNLLTKDVAPAPLLWLLPLCLYLVSFILCFAPGPWYHHRVFSRLLTFGLFALAYALSYSGSGVDLRILSALLCGGLFVCCMFCHGELALLKPHPAYLTQFYLLVSLGGAVGGLFAALAAPHLFRDYYEFPLILGFCAALGFHAGERNAAAFIRLLLTLFLVAYVSYIFFSPGRGARFSERNFYGPVKVIPSGSGRDHRLTLLNGTISHGSQFTDPSRRRQATTYYGPQSGGALAITRSPAEPRRVGLVGLGPGTLAAYGRPGDYFRFYEINPLVIEAATRYFTYIADCKARVDIVEGDARLSLVKEPPQDFDVLVLDAFSGDSIPIHLLTREAFQIYSRHLKANGLLAVHISNRFLDLAPLLASLAQPAHRVAWSVVSPGNPETGTHTATWVLIAPAETFRKDPVFRLAGKQISPPVGFRSWTDDYSNLLPLIK